MENLIASIDLSLRSTGICIINEEGSLIEYQVISNLKEKNEELVIKNIKDIIHFLKDYKLRYIVIEGLSYMGISSNKDLIAGNFWHLRCLLSLTFPNISVIIVPVTQWRKLIISKNRSKELKEEIKLGNIKKNNWQKIECVRLLPEDIKIKFLEYIKYSKKKKDSIFDLTDSYFIGQWCIKEKL